MARSNFPACLEVTLVHEGGWADHPRDPGGATMKGVTIGTFRRYRPGATKDDLRAISDADLRRIYRDGYWNPVMGDELPVGVDLAVFDFGVNAGPGRAIKHLQRAVGETQDGKMGPKTLGAAVNAAAIDVIKAVCSSRLSFKQGLRTWDVFGRGWSRRVAEIEAKAVSMWLARAKKTPEIRREVLQTEADQAQATATRQERGAGGAAGAGGGAGGVDIAATGDVGIGTMAIVAVLVVIGLLVFLKSRQNKERAGAYLREAQG